MQGLAEVSAASDDDASPQSRQVPNAQNAPLSSVGAGAPLVSVIIGTRNSGATLRRCLESIVEQTYRPLEIVVIDNFSTDSSADIAREFTDRVYIMGPERCAQYNHGFRVAKGQCVYRVDSDFVLDAAVVRDSVDLVSQGYDAIVIPDTTDTSQGFWARVRALEKGCYIDDDWNVAARFFKTSVIRSLGGYDEALIGGEDYDLQNRLLKAGYRVGRTRSGEVHLDEPKTLKEIYEKQYFYGTTLRNFLSRNEDRGLRQLLPLRTAYLRHWRDFVRNPDLTAGFMVYELVKYTAAWRGWSNARSERLGRDQNPS